MKGKRDRKENGVESREKGKGKEKKGKKVKMEEEWKMLGEKGEKRGGKWCRSERKR